MYTIVHHVKSENSFMSILMDSLYMQIVSEIFEDIQLSRTSAQIQSYDVNYLTHICILRKLYVNLGTNIY